MTFRTCVKFKCLLYTFSCPKVSTGGWTTKFGKKKTKMSTWIISWNFSTFPWEKHHPKKNLSNYSWWFRNPKQPPFGCIKSCKIWDILPYQLVSRISEPSTVPSKTQVFHPHLQPSQPSSPLTSKFPRPIAALPMHGSSFPAGTPRKINGWNLKITYLKRKVIFQTCIFGFHVNFQGCTFFFEASQSLYNVLMLQSLLQVVLEWIVPKHHLTGYLGALAVDGYWISKYFSKKLVISLYLLENKTGVDIQPQWKVNWEYLKYISALSFPSQEGK